MNTKKAFSILLILSLFTLSTACISYVPHSNQPVVVNDSRIVYVIKHKIENNPLLGGTKLNIHSDEGSVTLKGRVQSYRQLSMVTEIAQSTPGVKDVDASKVVITKHNANENSQYLSDSMITAKIKGLFIQKKLFTYEDISVMTINVKTNNGVVHLSGTAPTHQVIHNAISIAYSVKGVKHVNSSIVLKR